MRKIITIIIAAVGTAAAVTGTVFAVRAAVLRKRADAAASESGGGCDEYTE